MELKLGKKYNLMFPTTITTKHLEEVGKHLSIINEIGKEQWERHLKLGELAINFFPDTIRGSFYDPLTGGVARKDPEPNFFVWQTLFLKSIMPEVRTKKLSVKLKLTKISDDATLYFFNHKRYGCYSCGSDDLHKFVGKKSVRRYSIMKGHIFPKAFTGDKI